MNRKKSLVIVESPSKAKTIEKYLGNEFEVVSTKGHIMDLPKTRLGIDTENSFEPKYLIIKDKKDIISNLKKKILNKQYIYLASDNDREGEAIAYHTFIVLKETAGDDNKFKRVVFNEITKQVIQDSIKEAREIDIKKVDSQKARRILDRLVGYKISPVLWKKIVKGISAGRVQTVALRFIVEREKERLSFNPEKYWKIKAQYEGDIDAELKKYKNQAYNDRDKNLSEEIMNHLKNIKNGEIVSINSNQSKAKQFPPFITSTMQQEAYRKLNMSAAKTMTVAQKLYEGIDIDKERIGLITYMRTDSVRISPVAVAQAKDYIEKSFGDDMYLYIPMANSKGKNTQDAHEAIRPTDVFITPDKIKNYLAKEEFKLYSIIWERFVASLMKPSVYENHIIEIQSGDCLFAAKYKKIIYEGALKVMKLLRADQKSDVYPDVKVKDVIKLLDVSSEEKITEPPARYDDASLIKKLKDEGIGRPSTYAPTLSILYNRNYTIKEEKKIVPTKLGIMVIDFLVKYFPSIFNYKFTASMEESLDKIEDGAMSYVSLITSFYENLEKLLESQPDMESLKETLIKKTGIACELCGHELIMRSGKYGEFIGCSNFPNCRNIKSLSFGPCPKCNEGFIVKRKSKQKTFYGCSNYPKCNWISNKKINFTHCPKCENVMLNNLESKKIVCTNSECKFEIKL